MKNMQQATKVFLEEIDIIAKNRKIDILNAKDNIEIKGQTYFVSETGNDDNDGKTPDTAWHSLEKVSNSKLNPGDGVLLRRGDIFRGKIIAKPGVTYAAYGHGAKPRIYSWDKNLADPSLWELFDAEHKIWQCKDKTLDAGTLVFNDGEAHSRKLIPSFINGRFVCRKQPDKVFDMKIEMDRDLDIFCSYAEVLTTRPSKGEDFPIPDLNDKSLGDLYLRCDRGNPGEVFDSIELLAKRHLISVGASPNVRIDNLCLKYCGQHAIAAGGERVVGLHVTNCEIGWIGGSIQHYFGTDPNYPQGTRGTVTRFGNGVEIYGGCDDYIVSDCYIYQIYDAGITHQITTYEKTYKMDNVLYKDNLIENCVYSIEYFLEKRDKSDSSMNGIEICGNIMRFSGYGWGQQRHNIDTPAHIKGWSYENTASNFIIHDNIFDRSAYRMLHLVALKPDSCPNMYRNTYIQTLGATLGQYGANEVSEPEILSFDDTADKKIKEIFGDREAVIWYIKD
jgi:hypothetical protein